MGAGTFEVEESFRFQGRTFEEYRRLFDFDPSSLSGSILDCPGGPSSFTAVARSIGVKAYAVDPQYGRPVSAMAADCERAVDDTEDQLRAKRDQFVWDYCGSVETRCRHLRAAGQRFVADYTQHPDRYIAAALPDLPFEDGAFERVLSAHLCFLFDDRLDLDFHRAAMADLCRVASEEVRVFPLASLDMTHSAFVAPVVEDLREQGHEVEFRDISYEFLPGVTEMLVVSV
ncbi:class I SAM-dependent methyltransferase [Halorientalis pallida]|uniref:Class I SAM-dependent methyltransferase n=1 Tax=Halorientalis pallida TaxID=2479928 RepID=A0A498KVH0_9EURY|nr:class I SAM-dependent methyltransferase [Halorientalis pallida]RXK48579.1 class I SAM-dependent methyltransferase [Halorientalis pallida]